MYIESVMNYTGSKFKILDHLIPNFDTTKRNFVDLFCGGGSVYINVLDQYQKIWINDIIGDLVGIHQSLILDDSIIGEVIKISPKSKEEFISLRNDYNQSPGPDKLWALILSSTNNMIRFNKKFKYNQTWGDRGWNSRTDKKVEQFIKSVRPHRDKINFSSLSFKEFKIPTDDYMVYIDPPYGRIKNPDGTLGKTQISEAGYNAFWDYSDDLNLYNYIKEIDKIGSSFMVSGVLNHSDKTSWMLDKLILDGFKYKEIEIDYNKVSKSGDKKTREIIIMNY
jgi:DNA adenine methylase Dam